MLQPAPSRWGQYTVYNIWDLYASSGSHEARGTGEGVLIVQQEWTLVHAA